MMRALRLVAALAAGVMSVALSGCTGSTEGNHHDALPCVGKTPQDIFCLWTDGTTVSEAKDEAVQLGLESVYRPYESLRVMGVTGVAPINASCVLVLTRNGATSINRLSLSVVKLGSSDKQQVLAKAAEDVNPNEANAFIKAATALCPVETS